ncbi:hypothetical protein D3C72_2124660 [compost metagenome]
MISPSLRMTSMPPPGITLGDWLLFSPPTMATLSGMRKYSAMPSSVFLLALDSSHSTRNSAIIAVMKSA